MKNLGKIVLFLLLLKGSLFADVKAFLDSRVVYSGEMVTYTLSMSGGDIQKPSITQICQNEVLSTSSQTSIESINGSYNKTYTLSYQFMPRKSCTIEAVGVKIDGKIEHSNSVKLLVKEPSQQMNAPFLLSLEASKTSLYVGEPFLVTLKLKQSLHAQAVDSKFIAPDFKGFWLKSQSEPVRVDDGEFLTTTLEYRLAPQREGNLTLKAAQLQVASRGANANSWGSFSPQVKWSSYFSNELNIRAEPLPNNASIIGDFSIKTEVKRNEINPNEALNVTVIVDGVGNLEDIKSFKPYVENVNIFDEKIEIKGDKLIQKLAFVSDANFSVPAFELVFFSTKTNSLQKIQTEAIPISVLGEGKQNELTIKRQEGSEVSSVKDEEEKNLHDNSMLVVLFTVGLLVGICIGVAFMIFKPYFLRKNKKDFNIKDEKVLLMKLIPYKDDADVKKMMDSLEKNIYSSVKEPLDKKLLKEILKRHDIS